MLLYISVFLMLQSLLPGGQKTNPSEVLSKKSISVFVNCCFSGCTSASHSFNNGLFSVLIQTLLLKHTIARPKDFQKLFGFDLKLFYFRSQEDFVDCSEGTSAPQRVPLGRLSFNSPCLLQAISNAVCIM